MITKIDKDITMCVMGEGTLYSGVIKDNEDNPRGIAFTKKPNELDGGVVFQIENMKGFTGFITPILTLMEEWQNANMLTGTDKEQQEFKELIASIKEASKPFKPSASE